MECRNASEMSGAAGFSFSLNLKSEPKRELEKSSALGFEAIEERKERVYIREIVDNKVLDNEPKEKELVIPVKQSSWLQKAKERVAREKRMKLEMRGNEKRERSESDVKDNDSVGGVTNDGTSPSEISQNVTVNDSSFQQKPVQGESSANPSSQPNTQPLSAEDEARLSILRDIIGENEAIRENPNLVIPLHDKSKDATDDTSGLSTAAQNRLPGYNSMNSEDYLRMEIDNLPEACSVDSDVYKRIRIEDFGKAMLRGMGWDGKNNVDPSVYEINPRPERLGLGAMPIILTKETKSAAKQSALEKESKRGYNGINRDWGSGETFCKGIQVGIISGRFKGKQATVVEKPRTFSDSVKVWFEGETKFYDLPKADMIVLNDLEKIQSFEDRYGSRSCAIQKEEYKDKKESPQKGKEQDSSHDDRHSSTSGKHRRHREHHSSHHRHSRHR